MFSNLPRKRQHPKSNQFAFELWLAFHRACCKQTTTTTATRMSPNKRFNEQNNRWGYKYLYISLPSFANQQLEMTKLRVVLGTRTTTAKFSYFRLELNAVIRVSFTRVSGGQLNDDDHCFHLSELNLKKICVRIPARGGKFNKENKAPFSSPEPPFLLVTWSENIIY